MDIDVDLVWNEEGTRLWFIIRTDGRARTYELTGNLWSTETNVDD
jgi:hypothetical protein